MTSIHITDDEYISTFLQSATNISAPNKQKYINNIQKIQKILNELSVIDAIAHHPEDLFTALQKQNWKETTITTYARNIYTMIKFHPHIANDHDLLLRWRTCLDKSDAGRKIKELNHYMNQRELEKFVHYNKCIEIFKTIPPEYNQTRLLFAMYLLIPPVRNDYWNCKICYHDAANAAMVEGNNINITPDKIVITINRYKTVKIYGPIITTCPLELDQLIRESLTRMPRHYLFTQSDGSPYTRAIDFSTWAAGRLQQFLHVPFDILTFRHVYLSRDEIKQMTPEQLFHLSKQMGHSLISQHRYIWNVEPSINDDV